MESLKTHEVTPLSGTDYDNLVSRMKAANVPVTEVQDDQGNRVVQLPHEAYLAHKVHLDKLKERRRARNKQAAASRRKNRTR